MGGEVNDKELAAKLRQQYEQKEEIDKDIPKETITLPSKGYFYPTNNPLSEGQVVLRYPTTRDEDILTTKSLIKNGTVVDEFIKALIISPKFEYDSLLIGDKTGLMVSSRILAYGPDYEFKMKCPYCGVENHITVMLDDLLSKEIDFDNYEQGQLEFEFTLPASKKNIKFKLLNSLDSKQIDSEIDALEDKNLTDNNEHQMSTRLKYAIVEIDGKREKSEIFNFVGKMLSRDSLALRKEIEKVTPDIELEFDFKCKNKKCGADERRNIPVGIGFFWPSGKL